MERNPAAPSGPKVGCTAKENPNNCNCDRLCGSLSIGRQDVGSILISEGHVHPYVCGATSCPQRPAVVLDRRATALPWRPSNLIVACPHGRCLAAPAIGREWATGSTSWSRERPFEPAAQSSGLKPFDHRRTVKTHSIYCGPKDHRAGLTRLSSQIRDVAPSPLSF